jgi:hypothetical protein
MIAAIFTSAMSASGGELNALATATIIDFYRRHFVKGASDTHYLLVSKLATMSWGLFACVVAMYSANQGSLIEVVNRYGSFFYGSLLGVFILAILTKRRLRRLLGLLAGMAVMLVIAFAPGTRDIAFPGITSSRSRSGRGMTISAFDPRRILRERRSKVHQASSNFLTAMDVRESPCSVDFLAAAHAEIAEAAAKMPRLLGGPRLMFNSVCRNREGRSKSQADTIGAAVTGRVVWGSSGSRSSQPGNAIAQKPAVQTLRSSAEDAVRVARVNGVLADTGWRSRPRREQLEVMRADLADGRRTSRERAGQRHRRWPTA